MHPALARSLRRIGGALLAVLGFCVVEGFALLAGVSPVGILLLAVVQPVVLAGTVLGIGVLVIGGIRRRTGRRAGGVTAVDLAVHAVLLVNSLLLLLILLTRGAAAGSWPHLAAMVATGTTALVGVPVAVWLGWMRAFTAVGAGAERSRVRRWTLRVSHAINLIAAAAVLLPGTGPVSSLLLGSPLT